jgi:triosephosphate isomerase
MAPRELFIAGNWKMNLLQDEARALVRKLLPAVGSGLRGVRVAVAPPFTSLAAVRELIANSRLALAAQNCHAEAKGARTGEVSAPMLRDAGCEYVILGHSERRTDFAENNQLVRSKMDAALAAGLKPIVCVGEREGEREAGQTAQVVETQVKGSVGGLDPKVAAASLTIAYEPVWAIGTGKTATPAQAQEVHAQIRHLLRGLFGDEAAQKIAIQYGGSVKGENAAELLAQPDIDGALVGGAALQADSFLKICEAAAAEASRRK